MVPARSSRHGLSCSRHLSRSQAEIPLIPAVQISRASSPSVDTQSQLPVSDQRRFICFPCAPCWPSPSGIQRRRCGNAFF
ncbi:hypothetical protein EHI43_34945 [Rhizobium leguminosarum]|nr:hypothetical protein EHI43_34945 [Rhizobium leguminosarum]